MKKIAFCIFDGEKQVFRKDLDIKVDKSDNKKVKKLTTPEDFNRLIPEIIKGGIDKEVVEQILEALNLKEEKAKLKL